MPDGKIKALGASAPGALNKLWLFTFLPLKSTAGNSERSSDGCKDGDCNLQNRFPSICFHSLNVEC